MRNTIASLVAALSLNFVAPTVQAASFTLDKSHTAVTFSIDHLGFSLVQGRFDEFDADIDFDSENPENSTVTFTIEAPSVETGWAKRDQQIRGADFLNVVEHPAIVFASKQIDVTGHDTAIMVGELSMNGKTREETFDVRMRKLAPSPFGQNLLTGGFVAEAAIDRTSYGVSYGADAIGNEVLVRVDLEIVEDQ